MLNTLADVIIACPDYIWLLPKKVLVNQVEFLGPVSIGWSISRLIIDWWINQIDGSIGQLVYRPMGRSVVRASGIARL